MTNKIAIWHWMDDVEDFQIETYEDFRYFELDGEWIMIQLNETSPNYKKFEDIHGLLLIMFEPDNDTIKIF